MGQELLNFFNNPTWLQLGCLEFGRAYFLNQELFKLFNSWGYAQIHLIIFWAPFLGDGLLNFLYNLFLLQLGSLGLKFKEGSRARVTLGSTLLVELYLTIYWATLRDFGLVRKPWMCSFQEAQVCSIWTRRLKVMAQTRKTAQTGLRLDIGPLRSLIAQPNEIQFKHGWTY